MDSLFFANLSMRARLSALLILLVCIGIPAWLYWYFFRQQVASIHLIIPEGISYHVTLQWKLQNDSLPLADKLIRIERECLWTCVISPVAPIRYDLMLTSSGKVNITDNIALTVSEQKFLNYAFREDIAIEQADILLLGNPDIGAALVGNAVKKDPDFTYTLVGVWRDDVVYAERISPTSRELGILSLERFSPLLDIPSWVGALSLDITGEYFIAPVFSTKTLLIARDISSQKEVPIRGVIWYSEGITESRILTDSGVVTEWRGSYGSNPRFTDWLDVSLSARIGYISRDDTERLALSNLPQGESILLSLDRATGKTQILKRWVDIRFLFLSQGVPVFLDSAGKAWRIGVVNN